MFRVLLSIAALLCGCEHRPTHAELEWEVLRATFRYYYDESLHSGELIAGEVVFVGTPGEMEFEKDGPTIQMFFHDPSAAWQAALASTGIAIRPASQTVFGCTDGMYHDPRTGGRAVVFCISSIAFPAVDHATVELSSEAGPLSGGASTYQLVREAGLWRVSDASTTAVF